jgi:RNA polymerase sigma-70 factor (ECF subfamily)
MKGPRFFRPRLVGGGDRKRDSQSPALAERFQRIMLPHMDAAYGFARYLTRDAATAEDIVQEAFLRAFRSFADWRGDNPKAWLLAIVRNCHVDTYRGRGDILRGAEGIEAIDDAQACTAPADELEDRVARQSDAAMLRHAIENLPEPFRETLVLRELEELSYKEIAAITAVPIGTVMSRLARARSMLADLLLPRGDDAWEGRS